MTVVDGDATGSGNELTVVRQALWGLPMQRFEHWHGQLELNSLADWKPVQLPENRRYVVAPPSAGDQMCGGVLDRLKPLHQSISNTIHV